MKKYDAVETGITTLFHLPSALGDAVRGTICQVSGLLLSEGGHVREEQKTQHEKHLPLSKLNNWVKLIIWNTENKEE